MHICMDEIRLAVPALLAGAAAVRYLYLRVMGRLAAAERRMDGAMRDAHEACQHDPKLDAEAAELKLWLENVSPLLGFTPDVRYALKDRILKDRSGFLVNGRIFPLYPYNMIPGGEWKRGTDGWEKAST